MKEIIDSIFREYGYKSNWKKDNVSFYMNVDKNLVSYFLTCFVDCSSTEIEEGEVDTLLRKLEDIYITNEKEYGGIKYAIMDTFEDKNAVSQIDKNTSAIYLLKIKDDFEVSNYKNVIYAIEESPKYFKRYIIPYTEKQVHELKTVLGNYEGENIIEILNDLVNNEEGYYALLDGKRKNSLYELVIRLFSKIPFLLYRFSAKSDDISLEQMVNENMEANLKKYDTAIQEGMVELDYLLGLESDLFSKESIEEEVSRLLRENEDAI